MQCFYKENPNYKVALDQLKHAQRFPFSPALFEIQREVIQPNLEAAVLGMKTSAEIMQRGGGEGQRDHRPSTSE